MAEQKVYCDINLLGNSIREVVIDAIEGNPEDLYEGRIWYNTTKHAVYFYDGSTVQEIARDVNLHYHANKDLLDTYTQTEADLADAVAKKHNHDNKALLDTYTQTEVDLADAVVKKHDHANKALLDTYTQTEVDLADAVTKKHDHANKAILDNIEEAYLTTHMQGVQRLESGDDNQIIVGDASDPLKFKWVKHEKNVVFENHPVSAEVVDGDVVVLINDIPGGNVFEWRRMNGTNPAYENGTYSFGVARNTRTVDSKKYADILFQGEHEDPAVNAIGVWYVDEYGRFTQAVTAVQAGVCMEIGKISLDGTPFVVEMT